MSNKLLLTIVGIVAFAIIFTAFVTVLNAESSNLFCSKKQRIKVTLKNEVKLDVAKEEILKVSNIKIIKVTNRDEEWSRMVNKMDLPKMENPFKNEFLITTKRKANIEKIYDEIKKLDFVENIEYITDEKCKDKK